jgi:hypothetical protein
MFLLAVLASLLLMTSRRAIWAQSGAGSIQGTVTDSTGAVVPGASIHVVNLATGVTGDTKANGVGFYQVPGLFTGTYRVTVTAPSMKTFTSSIDLLVAQNAVINTALTPGAVTEQVIVSGNAVQLTTTDNGAISSTLENARINQLPMNTRMLSDLMQKTTPGLENGGVNINGMKAEALEYSVDGAPTGDSMQGGISRTPQQQLIDPDAIQEVRMVTNSSGAEYAAPATAVVSTKSGTNALHGSFFWTTRNNAFGIAKSRQDPSDFAAPHYVRNEFGLSAGGPVILPHIYNGKDKTFWFFAYERYSLATSSAVLAKVPTVAMSQGNFGGLVNAKGVPQTLYDPSTTTSSPGCAANGGKPNPYCRTPFPNNQIPLSEESPMAKLYYELAPLPTNSANPLVTYNYNGLVPNFVVEPQETVRLDHEFNETNHAYLRYTQNLNVTNQVGSGPVNRAAPGIPYGAAAGNRQYGTNPTQTYLAAIGYTHIFSPTFFAETLLSQQWYSYKQEYGAQSVAPTVDFESMLGLPNNFGELGFPSISGMIYPLGTSQNVNQQESTITSTIDENLTKTVGRHQIQFGGRYRHERMANQPHGVADVDSITALPTAVYQPTSGANYTAVANTGNIDASLFLGSASQYQANLENPIVHSHVMEFDAYLQDNFHVSRNLTINLGLRYEAHPGLWVKDGLENSFDLKNDAQVLAVPPSTLIARGYTTQAIITNMENIGVKFETPAEAGMPDNLLRNYDLNFDPRIGIAYQPFGGRYGTVIRGGYGRYSMPMPTGNFINRDDISAPFAGTYTQSYATANQAIDGLPNELLRYNDPVKFGVMGMNTANVVNSNASNSILPGVALISTSPDSPPEIITETNFTIEQAFKGNSALRVSWVWTHSTNLSDQYVYNAAPTAYEWEMATGTVPPTGGASVIGTPLQNTYAATATRPYDQTTWGQNSMFNRNGWSNDNLLQVSLQRLFHHGSAYQISYVFSKPMRMGGYIGNSVASDANVSSPSVYPYANFPGARGKVGTMIPAYGAVYSGVLPPAPPTGLPIWADYHAMDKYQSYELDPGEPIQHISFSGIIDLPFGRGKRFLGNVNRFLNQIVGGFELAGTGSITSQIFQPSAGHWGAVSPIHVYKHKHPITDCRSGVCQKSYLWFNGYLAPTVTQGVAGSTCTSNCVSGLPADYVPEQTPIDNDPTSAYYGEDVVQVSAPGLGSSPVTLAYDAGPEGSGYLQKTWLNGPMNYTEDISIFKVFPIKEGMNLRVNVDAFNALNVQGWNNPGTDGVEDRLSSHNSPRELQLTMRFTF